MKKQETYLLLESYQLYYENNGNLILSAPTLEVTATIPAVVILLLEFLVGATLS